MSNILEEMTTQDLYEFKNMLSAFHRIADRGINEVSEKWLLETLPKSLPLFAHLVDYFDIPILERITINKRVLKTNKRIHEIKYLKYPPAECVTKYGRCNFPKTSVLYASNLHTALDEMQPEVGDLITRSIWRMKNEHLLKLCPIFHIQPTNGTFNPRSDDFEDKFYEIVNKEFTESYREAVIELSEFIAYHFSKSVNPNNDKDYLFSAYFADKLMNELDNGSIEGIYYPSVKSNLSFENVALKATVFDKYYYLSEVQESVITGISENGMIRNGITNSTEFDNEKETIIWKETLLQKELLDDFVKMYNLDLS